ncbi:MAG: GGDEF domain-containing protein, partial [Vibrio gallaecicus]
GIQHIDKFSMFEGGEYCSQSIESSFKVSDEIPTQDLAAISSIFKVPRLLCTSDDKLDNTYVVLKSGSLIDFREQRVWLPGEIMSDEVLSNRPYIKAFEDTGPKVLYKISGPYEDIVTQSKTMTISTKLKYGDKVVGYLNYDIAYDNLVPSKYADYFSLERSNHDNGRGFSLQLNELDPDLYLTYCTDILCIATFNSKMYKEKLFLSFIFVLLSFLLLMLTYYHYVKSQNLVKMLIDPLTRLSNRKAFNRLLNSRHYERSEFITIAVIDIDDFKRVNDSYGHLYGDYVIKEVSKIISRTTRCNGEAFRFGGEEFLVLITGPNASEALIILNRIRALIANTPFVFDGMTANITVSIGACSWEPSAMSSSEYLIHELSMADEQLYKVKNSGKNRVELGIRQSHQSLAMLDESENSHV